MSSSLRLKYAQKCT